MIWFAIKRVSKVFDPRHPDRQPGPQVTWLAINNPLSGKNPWVSTFTHLVIRPDLGNGLEQYKSHPEVVKALAAGDEVFFERYEMDLVDTWWINER